MRVRLSLLTALSLSSALGLSACATARSGSCESMAGAGFTPLSKPPADGAALLGSTEFAGESDVIWLAKGDDQRVACVYGHGLTNPSCDGTQGVAFARENGRWVSKGVLLSTCKLPSVT